MAAVLQPTLSSIRVPESVVALVDATVSRLDKMNPEDKGIVMDLISAAKRHIGARYHLGSSGPKSFDCSGFTSYVFRRMGISLNRSSREQHKQGEAVAQTQDLQPGDLVFFGRRGKTVNHVGIVTDVATDGTFHFIHASVSRGVRIDTTSDEYWSARYVGGRRIIGAEV